MVESTRDLPAVAEALRLPAPAPSPQSLAHDGTRLWVGSWETSRVYALDPRDGRVGDDVPAPGRPIGSVAAGGELRFVVSENGDDDHRFMRRFVPGTGFAAGATPCPDDTGSFLAHDGTAYWLSQRYDKRVLRLDGDGAPVRTIDVGHEIIGIAFAGARLYCSLWLGSKTGRCRIGYVEPHAADPRLHVVATVPFVGVSLAYDGDRFWTNDFKAGAVVAFARPAEPAA